MVRQISLAIVFLVLLSFVALLSTVRGSVNAPLVLETENRVYKVHQGDGLIRVLNALESLGIIDSALMIRADLWLSSTDLVVKTGEYRLYEGESILELLERMDRNDVIRYPVTIPEGVTFNWFLRALWDHPHLTRVLDGDRDKRLLELISPHTSPEGLFLPETYLIQSGDTDLDVLIRARSAMESTLLSAWENRSDASPLKAPYDALILASIVEKETAVPSERSEIAGVFSRRLLRGMRLQTDPTVIYGLGSKFDGNLTRRHLRDEANSFNTYRIPGLPPTPIALPGRDAITASVNPNDGDTLFFVAKGDGSHAFSRTLSEHEENVRRYQLRRREDYRSSPKQ